jgi:hypothetical protein
MSEEHAALSDSNHQVEVNFLPPDVVRILDHLFGEFLAAKGYGELVIEINNGGVKRVRRSDSHLIKVG